MNVDIALKEAKKGKLKPIYVCYGSESYLMEHFFQQMKQLIVPPEVSDFCLSQYDLHETALADVLVDAGTMSFAADKKLIIAKQASFFTGMKKSGKVEHNLELLKKYIAEPDPLTVLIFSVEQDKLDERKKIVKMLKEQGALVECRPLTEQQNTEWVTSRFADKKCSIDREGLQTLLLYTGADLQTLEIEIHKLTTYVGENGEVTKQTVEQLVHRNLEQNVFTLVEAIVNKQLNKALAYLHHLLLHKEEPIKICALVARQFRIITQVKHLQQIGYSDQQMASALSIHPYAAKLARNQTRQYDEDELKHIIIQLADLDFEMKTGKVDKVKGLEMFLFRTVLATHQ
ncbi:DNA polymerase III subunit delta [Longirhabdus pacifica]|uniref:DNA polymerase III subunit delta n=1 Tax=Longirhabdus pacifica TaxID=2305227 RepID=UPI0010086CCE|nr:DNA polymerase III subunit delta [Longirhabdus pacifica]